MAVIRKTPPKKKNKIVPIKSANPSVEPSLSDALLQSTGVGIYIIQGHKFVYINPFFEELSGYSLPELAGINPVDLIHPDERESAKQQAVTNLKNSRNMLPYEYRFLKKNGQIMWVLERITSIQYMRRRAAMGSFMVITKRKELERAIALSEKRHRAILDQMHDACFEVDLKDKLVFTNSFMCRTLQYKQDELIGGDYKIIIPESDSAAILEVFNRVYETGNADTNFSHRLKRKDGLEFFVETSISLIRDDDGKATGFICVGRDISERMRLEEALRQSEERYRTILEEMYDSYYEVDLSGNFVFVNDSVCRNLGRKREELIGKNFSISVPPDESKKLYIAFNEVFRTGEPNKGFAHRISSKNHNILHAETSISLRKNEKGETIGFRSISRDVTERKKLEDALRRSEERFRTILENMQDSYFEVDLKGNYTFVNVSARNRLGYTKEELIGKNYRFTTPDEDLTNTQNAFSDVYNTGKPNKSLLHKTIRKDGMAIIVESSIDLLRDEQGQIIGFNSVSRDVTQRTEFEQRLADMATHDFLTGLPNRLLLNDRLYVALAQAQRNKNKLAIMTLDLNRFKNVNDTLGHHVGDELLKAVGQRLTGIIRAGDTIARMGGDEFMLLMPELKHSDDVEKITAKIIEAFTGPFIIEGHRLNISTTIGTAIFPDDGTDMDQLMKKSDSAMYFVKKHGPSQSR